MALSNLQLDARIMAQQKQIDALYAANVKQQAQIDQMYTDIQKMKEAAAYGT